MSDVECFGALVSIIVPMYNVEAYIDKCIKSVRNQTYKNIEIIIVNDGSTDRSGDIAEKHASEDERIRYFQKVNGGLSSARNYGIERARGEFFSFVDSDDWVDEKFVEKLYWAVKENSSDIAVCNMIYIYPDGTCNKNVPRINADVTVSADKAYRELLVGRKYRFHAPNKLYSSKLFSQIRYPEGQLFEDLLTTYKLFGEAKHVSLVSEDLYYYLQKRSGSILDSKFGERKMVVFDAIRSITLYCDSRNGDYSGELDCLYVLNVIGLTNQLLNSGKAMNKKEIARYRKRILDNKPDGLKYWFNPFINLKHKIQFFLIKHGFLLYSGIWKLRGVSG